MPNTVAIVVFEHKQTNWNDTNRAWVTEMMDFLKENDGRIHKVSNHPRLMVVLADEAPEPDDVVGWLANQPGDRTSIVVYTFIRNPTDGMSDEEIVSMVPEILERHKEDRLN